MKNYFVAFEFGTAMIVIARDEEHAHKVAVKSLDYPKDWGSVVECRYANLLDI